MDLPLKSDILEKTTRSDLLHITGLFIKDPRLFLRYLKELAGEEKKTIFSNIMTLKGAQPIVVISDKLLLKKMLKEYEDSLDKSDLIDAFLRIVKVTNLAMAASENGVWRELRKRINITGLFTLKNQAKYALLDRSIANDVFSNALSLGNDTYIDIHNNFSLPYVSRVLNNFMFGSDMDPELVSVLAQSIGKAMVDIKKTLPVASVTLLREIAALALGVDGNIANIQNITKEIIESFKNNLDNQDMSESGQIRYKEDTLLGKLLNNGTSLEEIVSNLILMFLAGSETTSNAITYIIYALRKDKVKIDFPKDGSKEEYESEWIDIDKIYEEVRIAYEELSLNKAENLQRLLESRDYMKKTPLLSNLIYTIIKDSEIVPMVFRGNPNQEIRLENGLTINKGSFLIYLLGDLSFSDGARQCLGKDMSIVSIYIFFLELMKKRIKLNIDPNYDPEENTVLGASQGLRNMYGQIEYFK